jgi:2-polyprenyl-3-methyl-5-hydroxy-6-metoxy-1,4-benzoquinol methylase
VTDLMTKENFYCYLCGNNDCLKKYKLTDKPKGETEFGIGSDNYHRIISKCRNCNVYNNHHDYNLDNLYLESYNQITYSNGIKDNYNKIMNLPYGQSDNKYRVDRIINYLGRKNKSLDELEVLDVGSGLCVFLGELIKHGPKVSCVDPSDISVKHALENVRVHEAFQGDFFDINFNKKYDLITFNKVLEHVKKPLDMLLKAKSLLTKDGTIYIELPDGEVASKNGGFVDREEFYLEHYTIFSKKSLKYLVKKAGFKLDRMKSIHEPSDKYTVYVFIKCI